MSKSNTKVRNYTDKELLDRVKTLRNYRGIPKGRWILGVRSSEDTPNVFDDKFYEFEGEKFIRVITGTTNPGTEALKGGFLRFNKHGAGVLKSDMWYHDIWSYVYRASRGHELRQVNKCTVYRDGDRDGKSEEIGTPITGLFGINYHTNTFKWYNNIVKWFIGGWSYGCQVANQREKYIAQMKWYKLAKSNGTQRYVTYCLLKEF